ncbi:uncharacterized protein [Triticum aestivum]|uniref:uncharacterized protein n=1 Tax=Triticum aestivum TaxID=4565 RepID=UPI001D02D885|nr:uncharacterized protein LOC123040103 [Triticum aestivum]
MTHEPPQTRHKVDRMESARQQETVLYPSIPGVLEHLLEDPTVKMLWQRVYSKPVKFEGNQMMQTPVSSNLQRPCAGMILCDVKPSPISVTKVISEPLSLRRESVQIWFCEQPSDRLGFPPWEPVQIWFCEQPSDPPRESCLNRVLVDWIAQEFSPLDRPQILQQQFHRWIFKKMFESPGIDGLRDSFLLSSGFRVKNFVATLGGS